MSMTVSGMTGGHAPQAMSGASARMPTTQKMAKLFTKIDANATGSITQSQFTQAFQTMKPPAAFQSMGPSAAFQALNPSSDGTVSRQNFIQGMAQLSARLGAGGTQGG